MPFDEETVRSIIGTLFNADCHYNKWYLGGYSKEVDGKIDSYYEDKPDGDPEGIRINAAVNSILELKGGFIKLDYLLDRPSDILLHIYPNELLNVSISVPEVYFRNEETSEDNFIKSLSLGKALYETLKPQKGYADIDTDRRDSDTGIYWSNFFSLEMVEKIGSEKLFSAPVWNVEELKDGGILLILTPNPLGVNEVEKKRKEIGKYLGTLVDNFFDA